MAVVGDEGQANKSLAGWCLRICLNTSPSIGLSLGFIQWSSSFSLWYYPFHLTTVLLNLYDIGRGGVQKPRVLTIHQAGFNLPLLSSFDYDKSVYGMACSITANTGIKNCHHHCHPQRQQFTILPGQQV